MRRYLSKPKSEIYLTVYCDAENPHIWGWDIICGHALVDSWLLLGDASDLHILPLSDEAASGNTCRTEEEGSETCILFSETPATAEAWVTLPERQKNKYINNNDLKKK